MRNLTCLLPDGHIPVETWMPHGCGGYYMHEAWCHGPRGRVGWWFRSADAQELLAALQRIAEYDVAAAHGYVDEWTEADAFRCVQQIAGDALAKSEDRA